MPTAEQMFKALREEYTDDELRNLSQAISQLLAAYDRIAATHIVNPALLARTEEGGVRLAS